MGMLLATKTEAKKLPEVVQTDNLLFFFSQQNDLVSKEVLPSNST